MEKGKPTVKKATVLKNEIMPTSQRWIQLRVEGVGTLNISQCPDGKIKNAFMFVSDNSNSQ